MLIGSSDIDVPKDAVKLEKRDSSSDKKALDIAKHDGDHAVALANTYCANRSRTNLEAPKKVGTEKVLIISEEPHVVGDKSKVVGPTVSVYGG